MSRNWILINKPKRWTVLPIFLCGCIMSMSELHSIVAILLLCKIAGDPTESWWDIWAWKQRPLCYIWGIDYSQCPLTTFPSLMLRRRVCDSPWCLQFTQLSCNFIFLNVNYTFADNVMRLKTILWTSYLWKFEMNNDLSWSSTWYECSIKIIKRVHVFIFIFIPHFSCCNWRVKILVHTTSNILYEWRVRYLIKKSCK